MSTHKPLGPGHFRPRPRLAASAMPGAAKLGARLADAAAAALARFSKANWRVALDRILDDGRPPAGGEARALRFESEAGSLAANLVLDREALSAVIEAVMGGNGIEAAFELGDRPLSRIERAVVRLLCDAIAEEMSAALAAQLGRAFSHFDGGEGPAGGEELTQFRFGVNVFGQNGEISLFMPRSELAHQLKAGGIEDGAERNDAAREALQRQMGFSDVELVVTLGPERLSVEEISGLGPGSFVALASTTTTPVTIWSGGVAAYHGRLARRGDRLAISITAVAT